MRSGRILSAIFLAIVLLNGCASYRGAVAPDRPPHHGAQGFRNWPPIDEPDASEIATLGALFDEALAAFRADTAAAARMATEPIGPAPGGADVAELAAWAATANVIMNLDEFLMRR